MSRHFDKKSLTLFDVQTSDAYEVDVIKRRAEWRLFDEQRLNTASDHVQFGPGGWRSKYLALPAAKITNARRKRRTRKLLAQCKLARAVEHIRPVNG